MQISKKNINKEIGEKIFKALYQVLADLKKAEEIEKFLNAILSKTEKTVLAKRLGIAWYLSQKKSYESIRKELKVSSATVATIQRTLEKDKGGLSLAIKTIEAEIWAREMASKVKNSVKKIFKK